MANSYENTIMPEKPVEQIKPDAIPVDDKGQPLPDPTESLSSYIAPKGVEELRKAYSEVEVDEDVRNTMEPPQKTGLLRKHRPGKRGYDYYGTPAGSVPNDSNGLKPSPLSELFSEAEALEPDFDLNKIRDHVLNQSPADGSGFMVVETPKLDPSAVKNADGSDKKSDDDLLKKPEVVKDPNAPKFLDMYKESTNTRVIYQSDGQDSGKAQLQKATEEAQKLFAEHSQVTKVKKRISKREEKKAIKAAIKAEKKAAKERRKAEKAARKAAKKAARKGIPAAETLNVTAPKEMIELREEAEEIIQNTAAETVEETQNNKAEAVRTAEDEKKAADAAAEAAKAEAEKQLELLNRQKEEAELEAQRAAQEAEKRLQKEKEALQKQKKETKTAQKERLQALIKLDEEKAAAKKAAKEAKAAKEEAERLKAELEAMKEAAAQALAQKQEAEEAARIAREEKEKLDGEMRADTEKEKTPEQAEASEENRQLIQKSEQADKNDEARTDEASDSIEEKPLIRSVMEKHMSEKKADELKEKSESGSADKDAKKIKKNNNGDIYMNSPTMEVIKRRIAEMEAQLSSNDSK